MLRKRPEVRPGMNRPRWSFMTSEPIADAAEGPMMTRHRLVQTPWFGVYVHEIHRPDRDRHVHDHPWTFATFILSGGYTEVAVPVRDAVMLAAMGTTNSTRRMWRRFTFHRFPRDHAHFIDSISGRLITFVFVGRRAQDWGFYTPDGFVAWREYISATGKTGPDPFNE